MGKRSWLDKALQEKYLPAIALLEDNEQGHQQATRLKDELRQSWAQRGFAAPDQQTSLMYQTRNAIKQQFGRKHFSLHWIKLGRNEYFQVNQKRQSNARDRQQHQQFLEKPDEIVRRATELLDSPEWAEVAAGIAVLTGRRLNEILKTAEFSVKSRWVVTFKGALKRGDDPVVFDIPSLARAERIVEATQRLRQITPPDANEAKVGHISDRTFADLVPLPHGKENLYSHLWRSVYCCIATFWYCPKHVDDLLFKAHIMGHFELLPQEEQGNTRILRQRLETFSSDRHYRLYEIDDKIIAQHMGKRKGIKLGHMGIKPLEVFEMGMEENQPEPLQRKQPSSLRIWKEDYEGIMAVLDLFDGKTRQDKVTQWVEWSLHHLTDQLKAATQQMPHSPVPTQEVQEDLLHDNPQGENLQALSLTKAQESDSPQEDELQAQPAGEEEHQAISPTITPSSASQHPTKPHKATQDDAIGSVAASPLEHQLGELVDVLRQFVAIQAQTISQKPIQPTEAQGDGNQTRDRKTRREQTAPQQTIKTAPEEAPEENLQKTTRAGRRRGDDDLIIDQAISALIAYNDEQQRLHDEKWLITVSLLKKFTPNNNQRAAQRGLDQRRQEIEAHHQKHQLQDNHNNRHKKHDVTAIVKL